MPPRIRRSATSKPALVAVPDIDDEPKPTRRRKPTTTAPPVVESTDDEPVTAKPVRRRKPATEAPPVVEPVDEPAPKPVRRRKPAAVEPGPAPVARNVRRLPAAAPEAEPKPVRRRKPAAAAATEAVVDAAPAQTPAQIRMAAVRAARKPKPAADPAVDVKPAVTKQRRTAKPAAKPRANAIEFGTAWLTDHISLKVGRDVTQFDVRAVLRKLANTGELKRVVGVDHNRYEFAGTTDATVKRVVGMFASGEAGKLKSDKLADLKAKPKPAAKPSADDDEPVVAPARRGRPPKAAAAVKPLVKEPRKPIAKAAPAKRRKPVAVPVDDDAEYEVDDDFDE